MRKPRLILTVLATSLEEMALAAFILWGLPRLGVKIPLGGLIAMMAGLAAYGIISYRLGIRALMRKPLAGLTDMAGCKGKVIEPLAPVGIIRISSELWEAKSTDHRIEVGEEVIVVGRDGLRLIVHKCNPGLEEGSQAGSSSGDS